MQTLTALTDRLRQARWIDLLPVLTLTLYRDRALGADAPSTTLYLSDRTAYVPRVTVTDDFDRADAADLGSVWTPGSGATGDPLRITTQRVRATTVGGDANYELHTTLPSGGEWAQTTLTTWTATLGTVRRAGALLRASAPTTKTWYEALAFTEAATTGTVLARWNAGVRTVLGTLDDAGWASGDTLRATVEDARLRVYRNELLLLDQTDVAPLLTGRVGMLIYTEGAVTDIELDTFRAGPLRHEVLGRVLSWSPTGASLDALQPEQAPATLEAILTNLAAIPGDGDLRTAVTRFSDLLRAGAATTGWDSRLGDVALDYLLKRPDGAWTTLGLDSIPIFRGTLDGDVLWTADTVTLRASTATGGVNPQSLAAIEDAPCSCPEGTGDPEEPPQWSLLASDPGTTLEFGGGFPTVLVLGTVRSVSNPASNLVANLATLEAIGRRIFAGQEAYTMPWLFIANGAFTQIRLTFDVSFSGGTIGDVDPALTIERAGFNAVPSDLFTDYFPRSGSYTIVTSEHPATIGTGRTLTLALNTATVYTYFQVSMNVDTPSVPGTHEARVPLTRVEML